MTTNLTIKTERVDDIPVLLTQAEKIDVAGLLDSHFIPHANWQGTSLGWTATIWLTHILSEGDHRLNHVQGWAAKRLDTLRICTDQPVREQGVRMSDLELQQIALLCKELGLVESGDAGKAQR